MAEAAAEEVGAAGVAVGTTTLMTQLQERTAMALTSAAAPPEPAPLAVACLPPPLDRVPAWACRCLVQVPEQAPELVLQQPPRQRILPAPAQACVPPL